MLGSGREGAGVSDYYERYAELNRRNSRARQRAYRELASRHAEEFAEILAYERWALEDDDGVVATRGRPRKAAS